MKPLKHKRQVDESVRRAEMPPEQQKLYDALIKAGGEVSGVPALTRSFHAICKAFDQKTVDGLSDWFNHLQPIDWSRLPVPARHCGRPMVQVLSEMSDKKSSAVTVHGFTVPQNKESLKEAVGEYVKRMQSGNVFSASDLAGIQRIVKETDQKLLGARVKGVRVGTHLRRVAMKAAEDSLRQMEKDANQYHGPMNSTSASVKQYFDNNIKDVNDRLKAVIDQCSKKKTIRHKERQAFMASAKKTAVKIVEGRRLLEALGYDAIPPREVKLFNQLLRVGKGLEPRAMAERFWRFCIKADPAVVTGLTTCLRRVSWNHIPAGYQSIRQRSEMMLQVLDSGIESEKYDIRSF